MIEYLNHFVTLIKRLTIAFFIFTVTRILFVLFNASHFSEIDYTSFIFGLRFDLVSICYLFSPFIFFSIIPVQARFFNNYQKFLKILFHSANTITLLFNCIDIAYFPFSLKRSTSDLFDFILKTNNIGTLVPQFIIDYWYILLIFIVLILITELLYRILKPIKKYKFYSKKDYYIHTLIFTITITLTVYGIRGGFQYKPLSVVSAGNYVSSSSIPIVLNTPFSILRTLGKSDLELVSYYTEKEVKEIYKPEVNLSYSSYSGNKNIVLIILESFSQEYIGFYNKTSTLTPFLDSLCSTSTIYLNAFANGQKSIDVLPAIYSGIPSLMNTPYISSSYSGNKLNTVIHHLNNNGYNSSFYHGGANGTMGFNSFVKICGITNYYGLDEYPLAEKDFDGNWGIFDEPYLQYFCDELSKKPSPFFSTIFTLSSHHPYTIPEKYEELIKSGSLPIHKTITYTDYALKKFFKKAQTSNWYNNTVFIITADHTAQAEAPFYKSSLGKYRIPIIIYEPTNKSNKTISEITQHIDIPQIIGKSANLVTKLSSFGNNNMQNNFAVQYNNGIYQITSDNIHLHFNGQKTIGLYNLQTDSLLKNNLINKKTSSSTKKKQLKIEQFIKAYIQQYNSKLINNKYHLN